MNSEIPFLSDSFLKQANMIFRFSPEITVQFEQTFRKIMNSQTLRTMVLESHRQFYGSSNDEGANMVWQRDRDILTDLMGEHAGMFAAVVLISGLPKLVEYYHSRGIPDNILVDTLRDVETWIYHYRYEHGVWGFDKFDWLKYHMNARLFRIGRLQFVREPFGYKIHVFRHIYSGQVIAFSSNGILYNRDGLVDGSNGLTDEEGKWQSRFEVTNEKITGHPLLPSGYVDRNIVAVDKAQWQEVLTEHDTVIHVHIPGGSKLKPEICHESYRQALDFFSKYFQDDEIKAIACSSWLLSPQLKQLLPMSSNIVRFMSDYHLFPVYSMDEWLFVSVFNTPEIDPATAPRDTVLRRAILDYMAEGNRMICGGGFILTEGKEWE